MDLKAALSGVTIFMNMLCTGPCRGGVGTGKGNVSGRGGSRV
jgi:hypothetical protein